MGSALPWDAAASRDVTPSPLDADRLGLGKRGRLKLSPGWRAQRVGRETYTPRDVSEHAGHAGLPDGWRGRGTGHVPSARAVPVSPQPQSPGELAGEAVE